MSGVWGITLLMVFSLAPAVGAPADAASQAVLVVSLEGPENAVHVMRSGATVWDPARTGQTLYPGDRIRTGDRGRVTLRWTDNSTVRLRPFSVVLIEPSRDTRSLGVHLLNGLLYFFHRDRPTEARFNTHTASAAIRGTELMFEFDEGTGRTTVTLLDGLVELTNAAGRLELVSGEQGIAGPAGPPTKTAVIQTVNLIQWCLYYPGILDVDELALTEDTRRALAESLEAYRSGDLLGALAAYPEGRTPASPEETVYEAAVQLAVGKVDRAADRLRPLLAEGDPIGRSTRLAAALRTLIAAVTLQPAPAVELPEPLASEWLAESYAAQSRGDLSGALGAAWQAVGQSPRFGLAWARVAELEFSFGHTTRALAALDRALELSPRNAQALALKGFLLAAGNQVAAALGWFDQAIALDGGLGNAWLGRGLCKVRQGRVREGKDDLQVAVTVEPQRALLRSYLGKAYSVAGNNRQARKELDLAKTADPNDPTSWLYSALLNQQENRINDAVRDLEQSQALNDNRRLYRSRLLLDQDRAVRGANLASVYRDAGMADVSVQEAGRAVSADYANASAHYFLADSYNEYRGYGRTDLRYETPAVSEYLIANLLSDVRSGPLSPQVSQQEYGRLFDRDRLGFASSTDYLSRGAWRQSAVQHGLVGNSRYAVDVLYHSDPGQRPNNDLDLFSLSARFKQQLTAADSVYVQALYSDVESGDMIPSYDNVGNPDLRVKETQEPILLAGYHHQWSPGSHTLVLGGRLQDTVRISDVNNDVFAQFKLRGNGVTGFPADVANGALVFPYWPRGGLAYRSEFEAYTLEVQQLCQNRTDRGGHGLVAGARVQAGSLDTQTRLGDFLVPALVLYNPWHTNWNASWGYPGYATNQDTHLLRVSAYAYYHWQPASPFLFTLGLTYDWLDYPQNHRFAPTSGRQAGADQLSPKWGLMWTPAEFLSFRAAYSRSLGGVSLEQSFQLEPTQVAGFNQAFRSLMPESVVGSIPAAQFETWNLALEQKVGRGTFLGAQAQWLGSEADRGVGVFTLFEDDPMRAVPSGTTERLDYDERTLLVTFNQLVGRHGVLGARYRMSDAELTRSLPGIPVELSAALAHRRHVATLHQLHLYGLVHHPSGLFGSLESIWSQQSNRGYAPDMPGSDFWHLNAFVGYRFSRRHAELQLGLLNLTDRDYRLNPLNLTAELPRERTLAVSCRFWF